MHILTDVMLFNILLIRIVGYTATRNDAAHARRSPPGNCLVEPEFGSSHVSSVDYGRGSPPGNCLVRSEMETTPEACVATNLQGDDCKQYDGKSGIHIFHDKLIIKQINLIFEKG